MTKPILFDMETGDPDDVLTLALLATHPEAHLRAVTITPGTPHQVGIVRHVLERLGRTDVPVGAFDLNHKAGQVTCVSPWHYKAFGNVPPSIDAEAGPTLLGRVLGPSTHLVTGAPLKNLGALLQRMWVRLFDRTPNLGRLTIQGGFAGDNVVPPEHRLPKFEGLATCPTYNLNGAPQDAQAVFSRRHWFEPPIRMVSKNVCHGVIYDHDLHERLRAVPDPHPGLALVIELMDAYLANRRQGKAFHDPLAAMCAIHPGIGQWVEVEPYLEQGCWGSEPRPGSGIKIIVRYDPDRFVQALTGGR